MADPQEDVRRYWISIGLPWAILTSGTDSRRQVEQAWLLGGGALECEGELGQLLVALDRLNQTWVEAGMVLLKNGITDLNTTRPKHLELVRKDLRDLALTTQPVVDVNAYQDLPTSGG